MTQTRDYYQMLGVPQDATSEEIKRAYRVLARQHHPDVQSESDGTSSLFRSVQEAYEILIDEQRRKAYDRQLSESGMRGQSLFSLETQISRPILPAIPEEQIVYMLFDIKPAQSLAKAQRLPLNLCLVIDRSTSMQGTRLEQVKSAASQLIDSLNADDSLGIVSFSDRADVVWQNQYLTDTVRAKSRLSSIQASGGTEILKGLEFGMRELELRRRQQSINHLILLTDGQTYGDEEECLELATRAKESNIGISAMGIGEDWNDKLLDGLASKSGGVSHYIASAAEVVAIMKDRLHGLTSLYGDELLLHVRLAEGSQLRGAYSLTPYIQRSNIDDSQSLTIGALEADSTITGLLEIVIKEQRPGEHRILQLELVGNVPALERYGERVRKDVTFTFSADAPDQQVVPAALLNALAKITIFQMQESAWNSLDEGDVAAATQRLETMATRLLDLGEHKLARAALLEAGRLARSGHLSPGGQKTIKYGTRSLSLSPP